MDKLVIPQRALDIYRCLKGAAERGEECPSNNFLAAVGGYEKAASASDAVKLLEAAGLLTIVRFTKARIVTITETGKSTKSVAGQAVRYLPNRKRMKVAA